MLASNLSSRPNPADQSCEPIGCKVAIAEVRTYPVAGCSRLTAVDTGAAPYASRRPTPVVHDRKLAAAKRPVNLRGPQRFVGPA
jgi:hypothetical protein